AQAAILYPIHILFYFLPIPAAWSLKLFLNLLLAGFLTSIFVRSLGAERIPALTAGVIYTLCGFITGWQGQAITDAAVWLPLICWWVNRVYNSPSVLPAAAGACAFALPILAGHPETGAHTTLMGLAFFFWLVLTGGWSRQSMLLRLKWFTA